MKNDSVEVAFELMLSELDKKADDLNAEIAAFFRNSNYSEATAKAQIGSRLKDFRTKVEVLRSEWLNKHAETFPTTDDDELDTIARKITSAFKSAKTVLVVKFPDGQSICEKFAAETFSKSIRKIGFEKVRGLGLTVNHESLVGRVAPKKYDFASIDGYYITVFVKQVVR